MKLGNIRFGLCCAFRDQPIKFFTTTATAVGRLERDAALEKLNQLCAKNATSLMAALQYCAQHEIGCFRVNSQILPIKTHPLYGYRVEDLPDGAAIQNGFQRCGEFARQKNIRCCFHPDQFVVLNSPRAEVVEQSLAELEYQAEVAEWVGADAINIHAGGAYGDKRHALTTFARNVERLSARARQRLTVENDDKVYTPADLLPVCKAEGIPLVYDAHHHRCLGDGLSVEAATEAAWATWNREPLFHISSPLEGWSGPRTARHHDFIDPADFPAAWLDLALTVEVEAKAKEVAVFQLRRSLEQRGLGH